MTLPQPKFVIGQKVLIVRPSQPEGSPGVVGGCTITDGIDYLVVYGDNVMAGTREANREWLPEEYLKERNATAAGPAE